MINSLLEKLKHAGDNYFEVIDGRSNKSILFRDMYRDVMRSANMLIDKGCRSGDNIGFIGDNCYEFIVFDLACISLGLKTVHLNNKSQQNADKLISQYDIKFLFSNIQNLCEKNIALSILEYEYYSTDEYQIYRYELSDVFTYKFTSGSTGNQKCIAVRVKHFDYLIKTANDLFKFLPSDKLLVFMPFSIFLQRCYIYGAILYGYNIVMMPLTSIFSMLADCQPTIIVGVPHFFKSIRNYVEVISEPDYHAKNLKKILGDKIRYLITGSAQAAKDLLHWYFNAGLVLYEAYGVSEVGMVSFNYPDNYRFGSVGRVAPGMEILIDDHGEIRVRSEFSTNDRYHPSCEESYCDVNGFFNTGDVGYLDQDHYLYLIGRSKNIINLSNGNKVNAESVEACFESIKQISSETIFGSGRPYLVAVINMKPGVSFDDVKTEYEVINNSFEEKIYRNIISYKEFNAENMLLTSSFKKNRKNIFDEFELEISSLYE